MLRLACPLFAAVLALPAAAAGQEQRDWLITGQMIPRAPDLLSRDLEPPPLDLATTQVMPGQWLYLPPEPRSIPQADRDQAAPEEAYGILRELEPGFFADPHAPGMPEP
jgi:hypothetical protein